MLPFWNVPTYVRGRLSLRKPSVEGRRREDCGEPLAARQLRGLHGLLSSRLSCLCHPPFVAHIPGDVSQVHWAFVWSFGTILADCQLCPLSCPSPAEGEDPAPGATPLGESAGQPSEAAPPEMPTSRRRAGRGKVVTRPLSQSCM